MIAICNLAKCFDFQLTFYDFVEAEKVNCAPIRPLFVHNKADMSLLFKEQNTILSSPTYIHNISAIKACSSIFLQTKFTDICWCNEHPTDCLDICWLEFEYFYDNSFIMRI